MEKKSAEEVALARIEEIKKEYYLRLDSIDLSFASLQEHKPIVRDYFPDFPEQNAVSQQSTTAVSTLESPDSFKTQREKPIESLEPKEDHSELSLGHGMIEKLLSEPNPQEKKKVEKDFFAEINPESLRRKAELEATAPSKEIKEEKENYLPSREPVLPSSKPKVDFFPDSADESPKTEAESKDKEISPSLLDVESVEEEKLLIEKTAPPAVSASLKRAVSSRLKKFPLGERLFSFYPLLVLGVIVAGGVSLGIWEEYSSWEKALPFSDPVGLVATGDHLLSLDAPEKLLYTLKGSSGHVIKKESFVCDNASGFAGFQNEFWCSEADKGDVRRYFVVNGSEYELQRVYQTFGAKIGALYSDGSYLWGADAASGQIFQYLIVKALTGILLTPIDRFTVSDISPSGLYASHGILWILDSKNWQIKRFKISVSKADPIDFYDLKSKMKPVGELAGFSVNDGRVYVLTRHPSKIFSFNLKDLPHHLLVTSAAAQNGANAR